MRHPFEATRDELSATTSEYVDAVIGSLQSSFMVMPKGTGFVEYSVFESAYQVLRKVTAGFADVSVEPILSAVEASAMSLVVLRTILGFTPPEWAHIASQRTGIQVSEQFARNIDGRIRSKPDRRLSIRPSSAPRIRALVQAACELISEGAPEIGSATVHRLDKADTKAGLDSLRQVSSLNVPYAIVLYERLLGRPFATHRDAVSERVGDIMEIPVEDLLSGAGIPYRKTKRAERLPGFDQAPDFCVPDEFNPQIVIEAKITEDSGTARDKITRVQRLALMNPERVARGTPEFEVVACVDGRGFVRRSDLEKLILATNGKVFTLETLKFLVSHTRLSEYATR